MKVLTSVRSKLLLAFAGLLTAITLVNVGMSAYLASRHGQADALTKLSQQLMQLQDDLQGAGDALRIVAQQAAADEKNLSDLATVYSEEHTLDRAYDDVRERALRFQKAGAVNRLRLVLDSARLSSLAVYVDGVLSHYVATDEAGLAVRRGADRAVVTLQGDLDTARPWFDAPQASLRHWSSPHVAARVTDTARVTTQFVFPTDDAMELRVVVPIQAVTREAFNAVVAERLSIAGQDRLPALATELPRVIGAFVFSQRFDARYLQRASAETGVLPAVLAADGRRGIELVEMRVPDDVQQGRSEGHVRLHQVDLGSGSFYQATRRWRPDDGPPLVLGAALSTETTAAHIRRTTGVAVGTAAVVLAAGLLLASALIARMVTPIKALTVAATSMGIAAINGSTSNTANGTLQASLARYLDAPVRPSTADEVGLLTGAFNVMAMRLHDVVEHLRRSNEALEAANTRLRDADEEVRALNVGLEQQVRDRTAQLEVANKELESFSYSVSHDLRAPLRTLDGFSRALTEDYAGVLDDTGRDYLERIRRASQHMGQLIDDLIDLARVTRSDLVRTPVDVSAMARAIGDDLHTSEPDRVLEFSIAPDLRADADPRLLHVVLSNLLHNACKFTSTRSPARIEVGETVHDGRRAFYVRDNGVGFDMTFAHKLFGAFQRLHPRSEFPGTGIGLATVQRIVLRHGGQVWAQGRLDEGATFYFTLPVPGARTSS